MHKITSPTSSWPEDSPRWFQSVLFSSQQSGRQIYIILRPQRRLKGSTTVSYPSPAQIHILALNFYGGWWWFSESLVGTCCVFVVFFSILGIFRLDIVLRPAGWLTVSESIGKLEVVSSYLMNYSDWKLHIQLRRFYIEHCSSFQCMFAQESLQNNFFKWF